MQLEKLARTTALIAITSLLAAGCDRATQGPSEPRFGFLNPPGPGISATFPALGNGKTTPEQFQVCKVGSSATFDYSVKNNATNAVVNSSISVQAGECWVLAAAGGSGPGATVTITETSAHSGYQLDHVNLHDQVGSPFLGDTTSTNTVSSGPTVSAVIGGRDLGERGATATYYNVPIPPSGQIGNFVWNDLNQNGVQDGGEPGLSGLTVTLSGSANASTTTNGSGNYLFSGLSAGSYTVTVATPAGYSVSPTGQGTVATDNNGSPASVVLPTNSSSDLDVDFGFYLTPPPPPSGQIGNFVWRDLNQNGVQDNGEPGLAGITVTLSGAANASTSTDANGNYLFTGLAAGSYTVTVATPAGYTASPTGQGTTATDNNGSPTNVSLPTNSSSNLDADFGFYVTPPPPPTGGQGCSLGYWKQSQHFDSYPAGVSPNDLFSKYFEDAFPNMTLVQVLSQGGGGLQALGRQIVAAYLNSLTVNFNLTTSQVVSQFNALFPNSAKNAYNPLQEQLNIWNSQQVCPLN